MRTRFHTSRPAAACACRRSPGEFWRCRGSQLLPECTARGSCCGARQRSSLHIHLLVVALLAVIHSWRGTRVVDPCLGLACSNRHCVGCDCSGRDHYSRVFARAQDHDLENRQRRSVAVPAMSLVVVGFLLRAGLYHPGRVAARGLLLLELLATPGPGLPRSSAHGGVADLARHGMCSANTEFGVRVGAFGCAVAAFFRIG